MLGCYDSIIVKDVKCPHCGRIIPRAEFQTKNGQCLLETYSIGEHFNISGPLHIRAIGSCPFCDEKTLRGEEVNAVFFDAIIDLEKDGRIKQVRIISSTVNVNAESNTYTK